jgi:hypothetical protein
MMPRLGLFYVCGQAASAGGSVAADEPTSLLLLVDLHTMHRTALFVSGIECHRERRRLPMVQIGTPPINACLT